MAASERGPALSSEASMVPGVPGKLDELRFLYRDTAFGCSMFFADSSTAEWEQHQNNPASCAKGVSYLQLVLRGVMLMDDLEALRRSSTVLVVTRVFAA